MQRNLKQYQYQYSTVFVVVDAQPELPISEKTLKGFS